MVRPSTTRAWLLDLALAGATAAWLGCGLSACGRAGAASTGQRAELAEEQRLYADLVEPLDAGQRALLRALAASDAKPIAFRLDAGGASPLAEVDAASAGDAGSAVF
ncbi:MAG TPA: hypothetical protein VL172_10570, partial [Kofleriaceae bacterium]|nr:hypothetical protein [Kofleriaceae bacterium]